MRHKTRKLADQILEKHRDSDHRDSPLPQKDQQKVETLLKNAQKFEDFRP